MLKVCLNILECERKFRVWKEWISVIGNDGGAIGEWLEIDENDWNGEMKRKALR